MELCEQILAINKVIVDGLCLIMLEKGVNRNLFSIMFENIYKILSAFDNI